MASLEILMPFRPRIPFRLSEPRAPQAVILGLNEIASAVAVAMHATGYAVVMSNDPEPPVIRRGMAFFDALYGDPVSVGGLTAVSAENTLAVRALALERQRVVVTDLDLMEIQTVGSIDVLIDARMQKHRVTPDLRHLAPVTVGLGPGFTVGHNCDLAIETKPGEEGRSFTSGGTKAADGISRRLGSLGRERFVYADASGIWRTALDVGARVFKGFPVGMIEGRIFEAPCDGILRGIARDGVVIRSGVKLIEIDPRGRAAQWTGTDERGTAIAEATVTAIARLRREQPGVAARLRLVKTDET